MRVVVEVKDLRVAATRAAGSLYVALPALLCIVFLFCFFFFFLGGGGGGRGLGFRGFLGFRIFQGLGFGFFLGFLGFRV